MGLFGVLFATVLLVIRARCSYVACALRLCVTGPLKQGSDGELWDIYVFGGSPIRYEEVFVVGFS